MANKHPVFLLSCLLILSSTTSLLAQEFKYGVYGAKWHEWVKNNSELISYYVYVTPRSPNAKNAKELESMFNLGIDVLAVQSVYKSGKERWMRSGAEPNVTPEIFSLETSNFYKIIDSQHFQGFSLDEENIWWGGRDQYLEDLYTELKSTLPDINIWQFFAEGPGRQKRKDRKKRFDISADAYIFDEYRLPSADYETLLRDYKIQEKPLVSILWASAGWEPASRTKRLRDGTWWNNEGWKMFYEKTMINRKLNVPTVYFMYDIEPTDFKGRLVPSFQSTDQCASNFVNWFFKITLPKIISEPINTNAPETRPSWISTSCPTKN